MEFAVELCFMFVGARMGYGNVKTLTDASVRNCVGDIRELQPTVMVGVPAVWETSAFFSSLFALGGLPSPRPSSAKDARGCNSTKSERTNAISIPLPPLLPLPTPSVRKGIVSKVKAAGALKSKVFDLAVSAKKFGGRGSILGNVADTVVFNAVKQGTGGKLKYALSGGAPISKDTQEFLTTALVMIIQGCVETFFLFDFPFPHPEKDGTDTVSSLAQLRHDRVDRDVLPPPSRVPHLPNRRCPRSLERDQACRRCVLLCSFFSSFVFLHSMTRH
jgi:hypothetical protein